MAKEQQGQCRKLSPKKQVRGRIQKRRTNTPPNYGREERLTANQQAWARTFTTSLSGWRNRQKFYKDHLEAKIQAEREGIATEAAYDAERRAQREADEQEAERKEEQQAEEEEERAEAWAHKAWEMHKAGHGVRKLKHEYFGWDPEDEEYPRDVETERVLARAKAKRMAERRAELLAAGENPDDAYNTDKDSDLDKSDSEGSAGSGDISFHSESSGSSSSSRSPSGSPPGSPPRPAPVVDRAPVVDWREEARAGVIKKKLSVTKAWGAITWNQKSNIQERLLVLEDDGYDISELLDGKASSDTVTDTILARAAGKQPSGSQTVQPSAQPGPPSPSQGGLWDLPLDELDPALLEQFLGPAGEDSPSGSPSASPPSSPPESSPGSSPGSPYSSAASSRHQSDNEPEDLTQPFSFDEPYYPQPSRQLKRKRDNSDDAEIEDELALSLPLQKKRRVQIFEDEAAAQALDEVKRTVLRKVFRSAREFDRKPLPMSRIVFIIQDPSADAKEQRPRHSSLGYLYPKTSRCGPTKSFDAADHEYRAPSPNNSEFSRRVSSTTSYSISKCALDNVMAELRFLSATAEGSTMFEIFDPDYDEDLDYTPMKPKERIKQNTRMMQRKASRITITVESEGQVTFQGDAIILAELLKALRAQELLHYAVREWDGLRLRRSNGLQWYLSPQTQDTFADVESRLERRSRTGGIEVTVGVVDNVRTDLA